MRYQIGFDGAVSAEVTHLLHTVEGHLNGRGLHLLGQADAQAQTAGSASTGQHSDRLTKDCSDCPQGGHCLVIVVVVAVIIVLVSIIAAGAGFLAGKRMYQVQGPYN
jgi:hypothetical protein